MLTFFLFLGLNCRIILHPQNGVYYSSLWSESSLVKTYKQPLLIQCGIAYGRAQPVLKNKQSNALCLMTGAYTWFLINHQRLHHLHIYLRHDVHTLRGNVKERVAIETCLANPQSKHKADLLHYWQQAIWNTLMTSLDVRGRSLCGLRNQLMQIQNSIQAGKMTQQVKVPATQPDFLEEQPGGRRELTPMWLPSQAC